MSELSDKSFIPEHDRIDEGDFLKIVADNKDYLEAKFLGDIAVFRAHVMQELLKHNAYSDGLGWAIFDTGSDQDTGSVLTIDGEREVLIFAIGKKLEIDPNTITIRIIVNQRFQPGNNTAFYLTEDCIVDKDGDAQYHMGAADVSDGSIKVMPGATPIFLVRDGELETGGVSSFPAMFKIFKDEDDPAKGSVSPYGLYTYDADRLYAFNKAKSLLAEISGKAPIHTKQTHNSM